MTNNQNSIKKVKKDVNKITNEINNIRNELDTCTLAVCTCDNRQNVTWTSIRKVKNHNEMKQYYEMEKYYMGENLNNIERVLSKYVAKVIFNTIMEYLKRDIRFEMEKKNLLHEPETKTYTCYYILYKKCKFEIRAIPEFWVIEIKATYNKYKIETMYRRSYHSDYSNKKNYKNEIVAKRFCRMGDYLVTRLSCAGLLMHSKDDMEELFKNSTIQELFDDVVHIYCDQVGISP